MEPTVPGKTEQASAAGRDGSGCHSGRQVSTGGSSSGAQESTGSPSEGSTSEGSDSSSEDSSSDSDITARPIFVKKGLKKASKNRPQKGPQKDPQTPSSALAKAEHHSKVQDTRTSDAIPFDGVDDTDDINPELEYENWKQRERQRKARDAGMLAEAEQQKEDFLRRKKAHLPV